MGCWEEAFTYVEVEAGERSSRRLAGLAPRSKSARLDAAFAVLGSAAKLAYVFRMTDQHRTCQCGAVYSRTHSMAPSREVNSFECSACGKTMESWDSAWVPNYRMIVGPIVQPVPGVGTFDSSVPSPRTEED